MTPAEWIIRELSAMFPGGSTLPAPYSALTPSTGSPAARVRGILDQQTQALERAEAAWDAWLLTHGVGDPWESIPALLQAYMAQEAGIIHQLAERWPTRTRRIDDAVTRPPLSQQLLAARAFA